MEEDKTETAESLPESEQPIELNDLHHYALLAICKACDEFGDQLIFAQTCHKICDIFVNHIWKFRPERLVVGPGTMAVRLHTRDHFFLAKHMRTHFTSFSSQYHSQSKYPEELDDYLQHLTMMGIKEFPKVELCSLYTQGTISDDVMVVLTKLIPNLKTLKLSRQRLSGCNIDKFLHLEELYLEHTLIDPEIIDTLLRSHPRLHTLDIHNHQEYLLRDIEAPLLQVLRLNSDTVEAMMPVIMALPNLRELEVKYCDNADDFEPTVVYHDGWPELVEIGGVHNIFPHVIVMKAAQITSITINNAGLHLPADWTAKLPQFQLPKLKKLLFFNWQHENLFLDGHLDQSELSVLAMGNWRFTTPESLGRLVHRFNKLKLLEFAQPDINYHEALKRIENVLKYPERAHQLMIWNWSYPKRLLTRADKAYWRKNKYIVHPSQDVRVYKRELYGFNVKFDNSPNA